MLHAWFVAVVAVLSIVVVAAVVDIETHFVVYQDHYHLLS
jgi:hypothetical protein